MSILDREDDLPYWATERISEIREELNKQTALVKDLKEEIRQAIITLAASGNNTEAARIMQRMIVLTGDNGTGHAFNK